MSTNRRATASRPSDGIQLVDEDDRGGRLPGLLEKVSDPGCAHADDHLDELGRAQTEKGHPRFAGHRAGEQRFPGPRSTDQQHALRNGPAEPLVLLGILEEVHNFDELVLGLFDAGDVVEGHPGLLLVVAFGAALAYAKNPTAGRGAPAQPDECPNQQNGWAKAQQYVLPERSTLVQRASVDDDALLLEQRFQARVGEGRSLGLEVGRGVGIGTARWERNLLLQRALNSVALTNDVLDIASLNLVLERRVGQAHVGGLGKQHAHQDPVGHHDDQEGEPPGSRAESAAAVFRRLAFGRRSRGTVAQCIRHG